MPAMYAYSGLMDMQASIFMQAIVAKATLDAKMPRQPESDDTAPRTRQAKLQRYLQEVGPIVSFCVTRLLQLTGMHMRAVTVGHACMPVFLACRPCF